MRSRDFNRIPRSLFAARILYGMAVLGGGALAATAPGCKSDDKSTTTTSSSGTGTCSLGDASEETPPAPALHTPRWAFEPWISKDISDVNDTYAFVQGFEDRNIPIGVVVLDSPWETNYNTFVPNPNRYGNFGQMVSDMHAKSVRVVVWTTAFNNSASFDLEVGGDTYTSPADGHDAAKLCGFFVDDGQEYAWWKGSGASIDFFNPHALAWWHRQQDPLLAMGVDGFKLDFGDSYVTSDPVKTSVGMQPHQAYSEAYYHDFYAYGRATRGDDFLTMVRAYDVSYGFPARFFARIEDAPVTWMGDNRRDYVGLTDALDEMFRSSAAGYAVVGSDIGGYLDRDDVDLTTLVPFDPAVFSRWTAIGALSPFMELHSRANLTPWTIDQQNDQITNLYRYWATLHHELAPFFYSLTQHAYAGGPMPLRGVGDSPDSWIGDYRFTLGDALLVAPILDGTGIRDVKLPDGASYYDFFQQSGSSLVGGQTVSGYDASDWSRLPMFWKRGAIVPMNVSNDVTGFGDAASSGATTVVVFPDASPTTFDLVDSDEASTMLSAQSTSGAGFSVGASRALTPMIFRVRDDQTPTSVSIDGAASAALSGQSAFDSAVTGWYYDSATRSVWIKVGPSASPHAIVAS